MKLSRFERKIVFTMMLVAIAPLIGAVMLGRSTLTNAYKVGVNDRVRSQLEAGVEQYRAHLSALRDDAERTADAIAFHHRLHAAFVGEEPADVGVFLRQCLQRYPHVARIRVRNEAGEWQEQVDSRRDPDHRNPVTLHRVVQEEDAFPAPTPSTDVDEADAYDDAYGDVAEDEGRDVPEAGAVSPGTTLVEIEVTAPVALLEAFQTAGEQAELFRKLEEETNYVSEAFLFVYVGGLALLIALALALGVLYSRRVTTRVVDLANAIRKVGAGDLSVQVPTSGSDEVMELTESFNAMVRDLRDSRVRIEYLQRIGAWQEFARRLAHEIKNPLTPIQLAIQEIHRSYGGGDRNFEAKLDDARVIIEEEVSTLRRLVGEFSGFAKLPTATLAAADLAEFVADVERTVPAILEDIFEDRQRPQVQFDAEGPLPVQVDSMMLKRCVDNLVRNALQALRTEGSKVQVAASRVSAEWIELVVEDDGPGIAADKRARVFDPYFTTKSDGTGLGLAIVKKVVLEHGGEITCEESVSGGARFVIRLPAQAS